MNVLISRNRLIGAAVALLFFPPYPVALQAAETPHPEAAPVIETPFLFEVMRHLYRWYIDETDVAKLAGVTNVTFHIRKVPSNLDPGDRSELAEINLPDFDISVDLKQANYEIEELGITVSNNTFKITRVTRGDTPEGGREIKIGYTELRDYLFRTRNNARFPEGELGRRMQRAAQEEMNRQHAAIGRPTTNAAQTIYLAPLSPVANETWVFWETGRKLIKYSSDLDLENPALWEHANLEVRTYDMEDQVVVALEEVPGSNAYLTRDQAGRALYNCIVLGRKVVLQPLEAVSDTRSPE